jgi:hypothetical protein
MKNYKQISFIVLGMMLSVASFGQEEWDNNTGEIEDVEVEIIKDREITLLKANRNFEKINPTFSTTQLPKFEYNFRSFDFEIPDLTFRLRPLRIKNEQLQKLYGGYLKAGFGNFGTPYLEGFVNNKRDQQYAYGAHVKHLSSKNGPIDDENSGVSESQVDLFGKVFTKKAVLGGNFGYAQDQVHFYGYPEGTITEADDIQQQFSKIKVNGFVRSNSKDKDPSYNLGVGYSHISDDLEAKEGVFSSSFDLKYPVSNDNSFQLNADVQLISRADNAISESRVLVEVKPTYSFALSGFRINAGLNIAYENDTLESMGKAHIYPIVNASYDISKHTTLYAGVEGGIVANNYHSAIERVPFLDANAPINFSNRLYEFAGGIRAKASKSSYVHAGFTMGGYKHYQYIFNEVTDLSKFTFDYDPETSTVGDLFAEWGLSQSQKVQLSLRGDYFIYNMGSSEEAWHQPQYKVTTLIKYNIYDKIILEANLHVLGGINVLDPVSSNVLELDPAINLGFQGSYLLSDQFSVFVKLDNVLSQEYQLLNRYPVRGMQVMAGLSYTF